MKYLKPLANLLLALYFAWQSTVPDPTNWVDVMMALSFTVLMCFDLFFDFSFEKN